MKSCSICASTIDQCVHTSIAPYHALTQPCYALPCLDPNVLHLGGVVARCAHGACTVRARFNVFGMVAQLVPR